MSGPFLYYFGGSNFDEKFLKTKLDEFGKVFDFRVFQDDLENNLGVGLAYLDEFEYKKIDGYQVQEFSKTDYIFTENCASFDKKSIYKDVIARQVQVKGRQRCNRKRKNVV